MFSGGPVRAVPVDHPGFGLAAYHVLSLCCGRVHFHHRQDTYQVCFTNHDHYAKYTKYIILLDTIVLIKRIINRPLTLTVLHRYNESDDNGKVHLMLQFSFPSEGISFYYFWLSMKRRNTAIAMRTCAREECRFL